jgi:hypothetical protein
MSEMGIKFWTALVAAMVSLVIGVITHLSSRSNLGTIEELRDGYGESRAERGAKRDYQYEARKRLYQECGPIVFQLAELSTSSTAQYSWRLPRRVQACLV